MVQTVKIALFALCTLLTSAAFGQAVPTCTVTATPETGTGLTPVSITWAAQNATVCTASGGWSGVKDCAGGTSTVTLSESRTFTLTARSNVGKATARWTKPTQNTDGTPTTVSGYKLFVADTPAGLLTATAIDLPATPLEYVFWRTPGDVSAGIKAVRSDGALSQMSNISSKTVTVATGTCNDTVKINATVKAPVLTLSWLKDLLGLKEDAGT